jgi:hypothetical protein
MGERDYREEQPSGDPAAGQGTNPAQGTPPVDQRDGVEGQTQTPAPDEDVGVPPEEEMNRE